MKIKICGLKYPADMEAIAALQPDYMGFICYEKSPRYIAELQETALRNLPESIQKTGVFVDEDEETINDFIEKFGFNAIQLHGSESPEFAHSFRDKVTVIKAFGLNADFDFSQLNAYMNKVDYFLFDTKTDLHGGSGLSFDWAVLDKYQLDVPFFLSGGLSLDNLPEVAQIKHPQFYGVDLNSKFELSAGLKDIEKLTAAFNMLKHYTHEVRS